MKECKKRGLMSLREILEDNKEYAYTLMECSRNRVDTMLINEIMFSKREILDEEHLGKLHDEYYDRATDALRYCDELISDKVAEITPLGKIAMELEHSSREGNLI